MQRMPFEVGQIYNRRHDIHGRYGGQRQGGISTPTSAPFIFIFTGESGEQFGYRDGWDGDGVFVYTGEGQRGDMQFVRGNRAIRDHAADGKDLLLFEALGRGKGYRFLGAFACANWEMRDGVDVDGKPRQAIVFHLIPTETAADSLETHSLDVGTATAGLSFDELRQRAYEAAANLSGPAGKQAKRTYRERSAAVRGYVLARAKGVCEACGAPAPFQRKDGSPYLEPHHTRRLSDGGPDHPRWVGAICPNCHRLIHYGAGGEEVNQELEAYLRNVESV